MKAMYRLTALLAAVILLAITAPLYASKVDEGIESTARESYVFRTYLKGDTIKIQSQDGFVTLTGTVAEESHKTLAPATLAGVPGVKTVYNMLEVRGESPAENSDTWLTMKVRATLLFHRSVSDSRTEVNVTGGTVTLQGEAVSQEQKDLTTEYAGDVIGIKDVINEMVVSRSPQKMRTVGETIDDASITALVKMTLLYHRSTSALNTAVTTSKGLVSLSGKAGTTGEKNLAARFAMDVNGVVSVRNFMTIE